MLPLNAPANPVNKDGVIVPQKKIWRQDEDEDEDNDDEEEDNFVTPPKHNKLAMQNTSTKKRKRQSTLI